MRTDRADGAARATSGSRRALRVLIPAVLVLVWLIGAAIGGPYFGRVSEVASNDPTAYLPSSAEATEVQHRLPDFRGGTGGTAAEAIPAIVVLTAHGDEAADTDADRADDSRQSGSPLTAEQREAIDELPDRLTELDVVSGSPSPPILSDDGQAAEIFVPLESTGSAGHAVEPLRAALPDLLPDGVTSEVTGPAGFSGDLVDAFSGIDGLLLLVAIAAVFVILIIVYRSPLLPLIVLMTSTFALCVALLTVWWLAKAGVFPLSGQTQGILFILVIGAATDYSLLVVNRFREALRSTARPWDAALAAVRGSFEPIVASGGTVIAGLLLLLLSELASNRALGPIAAIGIVFAMLASLTLLPALLALVGRAAFWPRIPVPAAGAPGGAAASARADFLPSADPIPRRGVWARIPRFVAQHSRPIWIGGVVLLLAASAGALQLKADGVPTSDLVLGHSEARDGQQTLGEHFPAGSGSPVYAIVESDRLADAASLALDTPGVEAVSVASTDSPSGSAPVTAEGVQPLVPGTPAPEPAVSRGEVLLQATLDSAPDSTAAEGTVRELRDELPDAQIGGVTATAIDSNTASIHDRTLIIPLVLLVTLLILIALLRALVAPLVLIASVALSFAATMGVSAIVFNGVLRLPGADPAVPLFGFVFLVALGIDYNIFLMTRVREEALVHGARAGMSRGLAVTGGVITSAGIVLAATFAALAVLPILFLLQLAFIVAFGVLLDTLLVRSLLVPAAGFELGRAMWWPSRRIEG